MNRTIIIIFYFGSFPAYFPLFLKACGQNPTIRWKMYTDNERDNSWPQNVEYAYMSFEECQKLIQSKFPFEINLHSPKKLCDFKPFYGYILEDTISQYDFWGHCDLDLIFGDLDSFLKPEYLELYDKIFTLGHFTLYRNVPEVNRFLLQSHAGRCKEVLQSSELTGFDEWGKNNVNDLFEKSSFRFLSEPFGADIWPEYTNFHLSWYDKNKKWYTFDKSNMCFFRVEVGHVYQYQKNERGIERKEFPYVHMQKRQFAINIDMDSAKTYDILPGSFSVPSDISEAMRSAVRKPLIDLQWLKIRWQNIRKRIRTRNFKFNR